jgi:ATP-dependent Clp protease ATP-binding subunit ClpC
VFERFTDRARGVVVLAQEEARLLGNNSIGTQHLLLGISRQGDGVAAEALESLGVSLAALRTQVEELVGPRRQAAGRSIPFTPGAKKALEGSLREAMKLGHGHIGPEHMLLALLDADSVALRILERSGTTATEVRERVLQLMESRPPDSLAPRYAVTLTSGGRVGERHSAGGVSSQCAFCGLDLQDVGYRIAGNEAVICEECIAAAGQVVSRAREQALPVGTPLYLHPPPTE